MSHNELYRGATQINDSIIGAFPITGNALSEDESLELPIVTRSLYVATGGNVKVKLRNGNVVTYENMQDGVSYPLQVRKVFIAGTTATGLLGEY